MMTLPVTPPPTPAAASGSISNRTSNTEEDAVHQRAQLVLQMAMSLETSNHRRRRQLQEIESGKTLHVQQVIEDIMLEKPASLMDILQEAEPENLPTAAQLKERYAKKTNDENEKSKKENKGRVVKTNEEEDDKDDFLEAADENIAQKKKSKGADKQDEDKDASQHDSDDDDEAEEEEDDDEDEDGGEFCQNKSEFRRSQDQLVAESASESPIPASALTDIPPEKLLAATQPLQEQLKRSYEAIVRLRENSDLRYQALEKKYLELKRAQQLQDKAKYAVESSISLSGAIAESSPALLAPADLSTMSEGPAKEQLMQCYQAIIRLKENSELRYGVLESKYLDLKRVHAEADSRNLRLEQDLEHLGEELRRARAHSADLFQENNNNNNSGARARDSMFLYNKTPAPVSPRAPAKNTIKIRKMLQEFHGLCEKVSSCQTCQGHVSAATIMKIEDLLYKLENDASESSATEEDATETEDDESEALSSLSGARRHDGAMALLGVNWEKLDKIEAKGGNFAGVSESKSEQKLKGKKSQFVACQSGVYCRIDHDMEQYGSLDRYQQAMPAPPQSPLVRRSPPPPALKNSPRHATSALKNSASPKPVPQTSTTGRNEKAVASASESPKPALRRSKGKPSPGGVGMGRKSVSFADHLTTESPVKSKSLGILKSTSTGMVMTPPLPPFGMEDDDEEEVKPLEKEEENPQAKQPRHLLAPSAPGEIPPKLEEQNEEVLSKGPDSSDTSVSVTSDASKEEKQKEIMKGAEGAGDSKSTWESDMNASQTSVGSRRSLTSTESSRARARRIPPARLDPAERKAKRQAALREAKEISRSVRQQAKERKGSLKGAEAFNDSTSVLSMNSTSSSDKAKQKKNSFFSNPFKRKSKTSEAMPAAEAKIPLVVQKAHQAPPPDQGSSPPPSAKQTPVVNPRPKQTPAAPPPPEQPAFIEV